MGGTAPLSVRARHPEWTKSHMAMPPVPPCSTAPAPLSSIQLGAPRPNSWGFVPAPGAPSPGAYVAPPQIQGVSPLAAGAAVYGGPTIGGPTIGGPSLPPAPKMASPAPAVDAAPKAAKAAKKDKAVK